MLQAIFFRLLWVTVLLNVSRQEEETFSNMNTLTDNVDKSFRQQPPWLHHRQRRSNGCGCGYDAATFCSGGDAPGAIRLGEYFRFRYGGRFSIYSCRNVQGRNYLSLHAEGRAVDLFVRGRTGARAFHHAIAIACDVGIQEVIFNHRIWMRRNGIRRYYGVNPHTNHVHIGLNRCGAVNFYR